MKLAINYSRAAAKLLADGCIDLDYFKCPDWPDMIADALRYRPVTVHFSLRAGTGLLHQTNWAFIENLLMLTKTPYVNLHLDPDIHDFPMKTGSIPANTQEPAHINQVFETLLADVWAVVEHFGPELVIAENVPYWGKNGSTLRPASDPGVIYKIIEETGCGLLLDISHARISARHRGMDETTYLASLPVDRVRELHITGLHTIPGGWKDHLPMLFEDWPWVDKVIENVKKGDWGPAWLLAFEYGGEGGWFDDHTEPSVIGEQVPRLWRALHGCR